MNKPEVALPVRRASFIDRSIDAWQGLVVIFLGLVVLGTLLDASKLSAPGAPIALFWSTIGAGVLLVIAHLPAVRHRLPRRAGWIVYGATLAYAVLWLMNLTSLQDAWEKTPQGAAEARANAEAERLDAQFEAQRTQKEAQAQKQEQVEQEAKDRQDKLVGCFSTFGHRLPKLEEAVKSSLGNPDSFDHVKTEAMPTDADGYDVLMTFRAQNRMGALWTYGIRAAVDPDSCSITNIESEPSES